MLVEDAVQRAVASHPELVRATADAVPKAWGSLAAQGVLAFRSLAGRPPTEDERRAVWSALWRAVRNITSAPGRAECGHAPLTSGAHAICEVCGGMLLCLECARTHYCTVECPARGCRAGLCVKEVRDGVVADGFGIG